MTQGSPIHVAADGASSWAFGRWQVLPRTRELLVDGLPVKVGSRAMDLLMALIEQRGRLVGKQHLFDRVWPGVKVDENNLHLHISSLRKLIGREAIKTIPGRGYLLAVDPVEMPATPKPATRSRLPVAPAELAITSPIPQDLTPLFGRDEELQALRHLIQQQRVVSVVGPGGVGKTRLAMESARAWQARSASPVCVLELSASTPGGPMAEVLARALGVTLPGHRDSLAELADLLRHRSVLLLVDNCEHRLDEVASLVETLMRQTELVRVLATSRAPLRTPGEHVYRLEPLGLPADTADAPTALRAGAVSLFCARLAAARHDFGLDDSNVADVVAICRSLDGLPLALELAAARVPLVGLQALRARLAGADEARLAILKGGSRSTMARHQTLTAAIDWSYRLLDEPSRRLFRELAVLPGGFTADTLAGVATAGSPEELVDRLGHLAEHSLLSVSHGPPLRYRMLDSTLAFAQEELRRSGELPEIRRRLAETVCQRLALGADERLRLIPRRRIVAAQAEIDTLRSSLDWLESAADQAPLHLALAGASAWVWSRASLRLEGLRRCRLALARVDAATPPELEAPLQVACARLSYRRAGPEDLVAGRRAIELYRRLGDRLELFLALCLLAPMLAMADDRPGGEAALAEMDQVFDPSWPAWLWGPRDWATGLCLSEWDRLDECAQVVERGLRLARAVNEPAPLAMAMMAREQCDSARGRLDSATAACREGIAMSRADGSRGRLGVLLGDLAALLAEQGQNDEALAAAREAASLRALNGTLWLLLDQIAAVALARGCIHEAAMALGRADRCHDWSAGRRHFQLKRVHARTAAALAAALAPDELMALKAHGARLSDEEVARLALGSVAT